MKLPIKKKYFDKIKSGEKTEELRDAHITFVCEETGETIMKIVEAVCVIKNPGTNPDVLSDEEVIKFYLVDED